MNKTIQVSYGVNNLIATRETCGGKSLNTAAIDVRISSAKSSVSRNVELPTIGILKSNHLKPLPLFQAKKQGNIQRNPINFESILENETD